MLGRVREAVADAAETLRQAFAGLKVTEVAAEPFRPRTGGSWPLGAEGRAGLEPPVAACRAMSRLAEATRAQALEPFRAGLCSEDGWARWGAEAEVVRMAPLSGGSAARMAVPPLPRKARALGGVEAPARPATRRLSAGLLPPAARALDPGLAGNQVRPGLDLVLSLPVPIRAEAIHLLPKGLWMRYSLQLVRGTGENVRNLEVLGLFRVPTKGVVDLRHDPGQGRILVRLEASAPRASRAPFILARRKDDGGLVSCFVEDP